MNLTVCYYPLHANVRVCMFSMCDTTWLNNMEYTGKKYMYIETQRIQLISIYSTYKIKRLHICKEQVLNCYGHKPWTHSNKSKCSTDFLIIFKTSNRIKR